MHRVRKGGAPGAAAALLSAAIILGACSGAAAPTSSVGPAPQATAAVERPLSREVSVAEAVALQEGGALVLDVREPDEWAAGHIPGATHIPLGDLAARAGELPKDHPIVVVCRSGNRSAQGRDILLGAGFGSVTSMAGGMNEWTAAGYPTTTG